MMIGIAVPNDTAPVAHSAWSIPTDAEELCMMAVINIPTSIPRNGLENMVSIFVNSGTSLSGATAPLIISIPNISTVNPRSIPPISCFFSDLVNMRNIIPITASIGEKDEGFNILINILSLCIPVRLSIHDVTVVPIFAPMMIPTACLSFMMPEFTSPTTITVVADDDWITPVTAAPSRTPFIGVDVSFSSIFSSLPPAVLARPSPITFIPYKNIASPPRRDNTLKISISFVSLLHFQLLLYKDLYTQYPFYSVCFIRVYCKRDM